MASQLRWFKHSPNFLPFWTLISFPVAGFLWFWLWLIQKTSRVEIQGQGANYTGPAIYAYWHKHIPLLVPYHGRFSRWMLVSNAPYMAPIAKWCNWSGLRLIRGASGEDGKAAMEKLESKLGEGDSFA